MNNNKHDATHNQPAVTKQNNRPRKVRYTHDAKSERNPVDDYPTPYAFVSELVDFLGLNTDEPIHEPCAGGGWAVAHLRRLGFEPTFEDLVYSGVDYLAEDYAPPQTGWVITNPPYKHAEAFARKAFSHTDGGVALLMNSSFIEALGRAKGLFKDFPPAYVLVNARKMRLRDGNPSVFAHYWLVWDHSHEGPTELHWVIPAGEIQMPSGMAPGVWRSRN